VGGREGGRVRKMTIGEGEGVRGRKCERVRHGEGERVRE